MQHPLDILERYWDYTSFKPKQEEIINAVIEGEDTFALLPTGGGKSLCYQIPALAKDGICIVISPLVALMKDQVQTLQAKGIKAMALTSGISFTELDTLLDNCIYGNYKFLYLSPERLQQDIVQDRIRQMHVNLIAVDEAHCISQWGNDFRPAYKNIKVLRTLQPSVNIIALTASATQEVIEDIITELDFISPKIFRQSFARPNIAYMVFNETDKHYKMEMILKKNRQPSIIYVRNRKATLEISNHLNSKNISATYYHGGLSHSEKDANLNPWFNDQKQVMVATNAFGMGIDKSNVKTVIHINLPESIESYFQEAGRAGRDGEKAYAVILKNDNDLDHVKHQFLNTRPTVSYIKTVYKKLCNYFQISYGEGVYETFEFNFYKFCKTYDFNTLLVYNAMQLLDRNSVINLSKQFNKQTKIKFLISNDALFNYLDKNMEVSIPVKSILRTYGGVTNHDTKINTLKVAEKSSISEEKLISILEQLNKDGIISLTLSQTDIQITFIEPREDDKTINRIAQIIEQQNKHKHDQVQSVIDYVNNENTCKSVQLLSYFGESDTDNCGICSVCITKKSNKPTDLSSIRNNVIKQLESGHQSSRMLIDNLNCSENDINTVLKQLLEHNIITITKTNTYKLSHL